MKIHDIEPGFITFGGARSPWGDKSRGFRRTPTHSNASEYSDPSGVFVPDDHNIPKTSGVFVKTGATTCLENCATLGNIRGGTMSEANGGVGQHEVRSDVFQAGWSSGTKTPESTSETNKSVKAPIPGVVVEIKVSEGEKVTKGMTVAVIEAMKMENDILAESDGTVAAIKVTTGAAVLEGDTILTIE